MPPQSSSTKRTSDVASHPHHRPPPQSTATSRVQSLRTYLHIAPNNNGPTSPAQENSKKSSHRPSHPDTSSGVPNSKTTNDTFTLPLSLLYIPFPPHSAICALCDATFHSALLCDDAGGDNVDLDFEGNTHLGCYKASQVVGTKSQRLLGTAAKEQRVPDLTWESCRDFCTTETSLNNGKPWRYFGIEFGRDCRCSNKLYYSVTDEPAKCTSKATGDPTQRAGGAGYADVWELGSTLKVDHQRAINTSSHFIEQLEASRTVFSIDYQVITIF
ncbi:hypothetical protein DM02DRAFT_673749 [Periconia macrospinosa]|uniref:WSC domain-containing protein n=1 Tax=Periconia macrospinosa TaxID=97972 RepID=A0A2V1DIY9_9PLEO|nr:hypothetical protein DM02DRAFT_673749 [Periconia macrospinosa]